MSSFVSPLAFDSGRDACRRGLPRSANAYDPHYASHGEWDRGWLSMHEQMMLDLKERAAPKQVGRPADE